MLRRPSLLIPALFALALAGAAAAQDPDPVPEAPPAPVVRVRLVSLGTPRQLTLRAAGPLRVTDASTGEELEGEGPALAISAVGGQLEVGERRAAALRVEAETITLGAGRGERIYPGTLLLTGTAAGLSVVNECSLESYVSGVLSAECPALFQPEAIKAMAVAARSYSYRKAFLGKAELCDGTHCQVYPGTGRVPASIRDAVRATAGTYALFQGEPIDAVYCSDCGGYTEANENAWKGARPIPYLRAVEDAPEPHGEPYCAGNRSHQWTLSLTRERLQSLLGKAGAAARLQAKALTESGRVRSLQIAPAPAPEDDPEGAPSPLAAAARLFSGEQWRRLLGLSAVKSLKFEIESTEQGVLLRGSGWGHGVGLCQFGANGMAKQGAKFDDILKHYYTGIEVGPLPAASPAPPTARLPERGTARAPRPDPRRA